LSELAKIFRTKEVNAMDALGRIIAACKAAGVTPRDTYASLSRIFQAGRSARIWRTRDEFARDLEEIVRARVGVEYRGQRYLIGVSLARQPGRDAVRLHLSRGPMWCWALRFIPES
jgi:hypothetical protein